MDNDFDNETAQLKGKIWYCVEQQIQEESKKANGIEVTHTSKFTNALVELTYMKMLEMGKDLEAFSKHANRHKITIDDLKLMLRKTPSLQKEILEAAGM